MKRGPGSHPSFPFITTFFLTLQKKHDGLTDRQVDMVLSPGGAYQVDVLHAQSAEIMAASRYVYLFFFSVGRRLECTQHVF